MKREKNFPHFPYNPEGSTGWPWNIGFGSPGEASGQGALHYTTTERLDEDVAGICWPGSYRLHSECDSCHALIIIRPAYRIFEVRRIEFRIDTACALDGSLTWIDNDFILVRSN